MQYEIKAKISREVTEIVEFEGDDSEYEAKFDVANRLLGSLCTDDVEMEVKEIKENG